jgi:hypothetical protein
MKRRGARLPLPPSRARHSAVLAAATISCLTFAYGVFSTPPSSYALATRGLASVVAAVSAGVPVNPENTLMQKLVEKEAELLQREKDLATREGTDSFFTVFFNPTVAPWSFLISLLSAILVGLNFYFDGRRNRASPRERVALGPTRVIDMR